MSKDLEKYKKLAPLLKQAQQRIIELNTKVNRLNKFANLEQGSPDQAVAVMEEVKQTLVEQGAPEEVAETAAQIAAEAIESGAPKEEVAPEASEEGLNPEMIEALTGIADELPADIKGNVTEMLEDKDADVNKMAALILPVLKKVAKKNAFSDLGSVSKSKTVNKLAIEKQAAIDEIKSICV